MKHLYITNTSLRKEVDRKILSLAWPAILSNITVPLLGLSDTFLSGHLGSELFLAAMAVAGTMVNSLFWLFGFLRMGTTGLTATAYGAGDIFTQNKVYTRATVIAVFAGILLIILSYPLFMLMKWIMSPPEEVVAPAYRYFLIIMLSAPATLATMAATGRLIGRQNTFYTMIIAVSVNVLNILLSILMVFVFDMGFAGVALGTTAANWLGLALALYLIVRQSEGRNPFIPLRTLLKQRDTSGFLKVNSFLFVRSCCLMIVTFAMTAFASRIGTLALAINAVMLQFFMFFSYFMDGFAFSGEALCGKYFGARDTSSFYLTVRRLVVIGIIMALLFSLIYGSLESPITSFLTSSPDVRDGMDRLRVIAILIPLVSAAAFIFDGIYVGITRTAEMMFSTMGGMILFFAINLLLLLCHLPLTSLALWLSFLVFLLTRGLVLALRLKSATSALRQRQ